MTAFRGLALALVVGAAAPATAAAEDPFDWTVGTWSGVRRDAASGRETPMRMRVEPILGGTGTLRRLEVGEPGEEPYLGVSVQVLDVETDRWVWVYTNRGRGRFAEYEAVEIDPSRSVWRPVEAGDIARRLTSELLEDGSWRRTMETSEDGEATWRALWVDELRFIGE